MTMKKITQTGVGDSSWVNMGASPKSNWSIMIDNPSGVTVTVEATLADVRKGAVPTAQQTQPIANLTSLTSSGIFGNLPVVNGIRLSVASGAGTVTATLLQPS